MSKPISILKPNLIWLLLFACLILALGAATHARAQVTADQIFSGLQGSVFQIRIIEAKSGSMAAMGTGFLVGENRLATNYHVVSMNVLEPDDYRIELRLAETTRVLTVVAADVVNDLALLAPTEGDLNGTAFTLAERTPARGELLYSLGNPHNLGMTVVQGNYNGLVEHKFLQRIHFSGAVNAGMSGGPTVDSQSRVVGVNVATSGNQIGFLVPVAKLSALLQRALEEPPAREVLLNNMAEQIRGTTDAMIAELLQAEWPTINMGKAVILDKTVDWLECWGNSEQDEERGLLEIARGCNSADNIYINNEFNTGFFEYEFYYLEVDAWPATSFYRLLAQNTANARPGNRAGEKQVGNYDCIDRVVKTRAVGDVPAMTRRISYCLRPYKTLPGLFDAFYIGVTQDKTNKAIMDHFTLSGVSRRASFDFLNRFVEVLKWQ